MKLHLGVLSGAVLILAGAIRILAGKNSSLMDTTINIASFIGLCIGIGALIFCVKGETKE